MNSLMDLSQLFGAPAEDGTAQTNDLYAGTDDEKRRQLAMRILAQLMPQQQQQAPRVQLPGLDQRAIPSLQVQAQPVQPQMGIADILKMAYLRSMLSGGAPAQQNGIDAMLRALQGNRGA